MIWYWRKPLLSIFGNDLSFGMFLSLTFITITIHHTVVAVGINLLLLLLCEGIWSIRLKLNLHSENIGIWAGMGFGKGKKKDQVYYKRSKASTFTHSSLILILNFNFNSHPSTEPNWTNDKWRIDSRHNIKSGTRKAVLLLHPCHIYHFTLICVIKTFTFDVEVVGNYFPGMKSFSCRNDSYGQK